MSEFKQETMKNLAQDVYEDEYREQTAPLVQDVRDLSMADHCSALNKNEYLDFVFAEMKTLFSKCDFGSRRNEPIEIHGDMMTAINSLFWPVIPSQLYDYKKNNPKTGMVPEIKTEIRFNIPHHKMAARYEGSFHIKNAVIRAKFVGDESCHCFYIGEHDKLGATVIISCNTDGKWLALMMDLRIPQSELKKFSEPRDVTIQHDVAELEEFTMLAVTDGLYYKNYMNPRTVSEDLAIFTCYDKTRNISCDTVASFKNGLCDPKTIFNSSNTEDVVASWAKHLGK